MNYSPALNVDIAISVSCQWLTSMWLEKLPEIPWWDGFLKGLDWLHLRTISFAYKSYEVNTSGYRWDVTLIQYCRFNLSGNADATPMQRKCWTEQPLSFGIVYRESWTTPISCIFRKDQFSLFLCKANTTDLSPGKPQSTWLSHWITEYQDNSNQHCHSNQLKQVHLLWVVPVGSQSCSDSVPFQATSQVSSDQDRHERKRLVGVGSKRRRYHLDFQLVEIELKDQREYLTVKRCK